MEGTRGRWIACQRCGIPVKVKKAGQLPFCDPHRKAHHRDLNAMRQADADEEKRWRKELAISDAEVPREEWAADRRMRRELAFDVVFAGDHGPSEAPGLLGSSYSRTERDLGGVDLFSRDDAPPKPRGVKKVRELHYGRWRPVEDRAAPVSAVAHGYDTAVASNLCDTVPTGEDGHVVKYGEFTPRRFPSPFAGRGDVWDRVRGEDRDTDRRKPRVTDPVPDEVVDTVPAGTGRQPAGYAVVDGMQRDRMTERYSTVDGPREGSSVTKWSELEGGAGFPGEGCLPPPLVAG